MIYDDDVNANKVTFTTDKKEDLCNHLIAMESIINLQVFILDYTFEVVFTFYVLNK